MSNSNLVNYTKLSPNYTKRTGVIRKITIHHMAGNLTVESCGNVFANPIREASSNYGIGTDGRVGLYVDESNRAWTSSNYENDNQAVTIEVANDEIGGCWHVSDTALNKLIKLCADICKRNGISKLNFTGDKNGNLTMHRYFANTNCPGQYLESKYPYIANEVNKILNGGTTSTPIISETVTSKPPTSTGSKQYLFLKGHMTKWNIYPTNVAPVTGNQCGTLNPSLFGGIEYEILGNPQKDVYTISTRDYGKVNIYVPKDNDSEFYSKGGSSNVTTPTPSVSNKEYLNLHSNVLSWRVYPTSKSPTIGNECGSLAPKNYGGLSYEILDKPQANVYTIQTSSFGKVNIFAPRDNDSSITANPKY